LIEDDLMKKMKQYVPGVPTVVIFMSIGGMIKGFDLHENFKKEY